MPVGRSNVARSVRGFSELGVISWWPLRARAADNCSLVAATSAIFLFLALLDSLSRSERAQCDGSLVQVSVRTRAQVVASVEVVMSARRGDSRMQF